MQTSTRWTLWSVCLSFLADGSVACLAADQTPTTKPNVVFILADDLGYGDLGCYGRHDIRTPNLDKLAREGVRMTNHYANGPECTPTRAAFLTGRYQQWIGGLECAIGTGNVGRYDDAIRLRETNDLGLPVEEPSIATRLRSTGYATAISGKWHLGYEPKFAPHHHGFDFTFYCIGGGMDYFHYLDNVAGYNLFQDGKPVRRDGYFTDLMTDEAIRFLKQQGGQPPFFLYVAYTCPHSPFQGPRDKRTDPLPLDSPLWNQSQAPPNVYRAMIEHMDLRIGDLLRVLAEQSLAKNTLVIFAGDNGGTRSARNVPLSGIKGSTFEGGIRVPGIVRWPSVLPAGTDSDQASITFDWTASIARLAGIARDGDRPLEGMDIIQHLSDSTPNVSRTLYWRKPRGTTVWEGVRHGTLKYVAKQTDQQREEYLFDLQRDVAEKNDLKASRQDEFRQLKTMYVQWERQVRSRRRGQRVRHE